jgi:hypothetical protein
MEDSLSGGMMEPVGIFLGLSLMFLALIIPGLALSFVFFKDVDLGERFFLSAILGVVPVYVVYFLLKNGVFGLNGWLIAVLFILSILSVFIDEDVRERISKSVHVA